MSESEVSTSEAGIKNENVVRKRVRTRKKLLYEKILKQMEFYFSDANLSKDRFLGELIKKDPCVPVDLFFKFNKIRALTQEATDIIKAMKKSTLLELSDDKLKVKRKIPLQPYDADARTVYVESIPVTANREWLERVFSDYGPVAYISLPKFRNSQRNKGYGFIEFTKPEYAQKCLGTFTKMGCKLPTSMPPEELSSIKTFSMDEPSDEPLDNKEEKEEYEPPKKKNRKSKERKLQKNLELKLNNENEPEKMLVTPKDENKSIIGTIEAREFRDENKSVAAPKEETQTITDAESKDEVTSQDEGKEGDTSRKKKGRKKTAKERSKRKNKLNANEAPKGALWGLQLLPKHEWKKLRNKYLTLQRKYMKDLKANIRNNKYYSSIPAPAETSEELEPAINRQELHNTKSAAPLEKTPGVFVKETLLEPCLDVRATKRTIRSNVHALHVDVKEGQSDVVIRFDSADAASEYCSASRLGARVLCGAEESEQWARAEAARGERRVRGRCRVLAKRDALAAAGTAPPAPASPQPTHTHIRFDEE